MNRVEQMAEIQNKALEVFKKKNQDYGDSFAIYGIIGVLIRMEDKLKRFIQISNTGITLVNDETIMDTLLDLHNYSAMAMMLYGEQHKNTET